MNAKTLCVVQLLLAVGCGVVENVGGSNDCNEEHHCHFVQGSPTCDDGYTWENSKDPENLRCVLSQTCDCDLTSECDDQCECDPVCGTCTPETDDAFCLRVGKDCNDVTADDNCGSSRTVNCGQCLFPESCGGSSIPNMCGDPLAHCVNGALDSDESDVDCGGSCAACDLGRLCDAQSDCAAGTCDQAICRDGTWWSIAPMPTPRGALGAVWGADGRLYAMGGIAPGSGGAMAVVEAYEPTLSAWTTVAPMPTARYGFAAVLGSDDRIYTIGGSYDDSVSPWVDGASVVVEVYTPATNSWSSVASLNNGRYKVAAVAADDGLIYAIAGFSVNPVEVLNTAETYNITTNTWTPMSEVMTTARSSHAAALGSNGTIYVAGGTDNGALSATEVHSPGTFGWFTQPRMPTPRKLAAGGVAANGRFYVFGGLGVGAPPVDTGDVVESFNPSDQTWSTVTRMPYGKYDHAVATGPNGYIFIVGGMLTGGFVATASSSVEVFVPSL